MPQKVIVESRVDGAEPFGGDVCRLSSGEATVAVNALHMYIVGVNLYIWDPGIPVFVDVLVMS